VVVLISFAFAVARVSGISSVLFQAFAHVWVGGLIGAYAMGAYHDRVDDGYRTPKWCAIGLSVVEVATAVVQRVF